MKNKKTDDNDIIDDYGIAEKVVDRNEFYIEGIDKARIILLICSILYTFGFHNSMLNLSSVLFGFAIPSLYIISGFVVLRDSTNTEKRICRTIKRTAICLAILVAVYTALSLAFETQETLNALKSKEFWIDFLAFNIWTLKIGQTIWFVQAELYAYMIVYALYKLKLLKFDIYIAIICLAFTLLTGELSRLFEFDFLGHAYISGNFLTRALPYILLGNFISRKKEEIDKVGVLLPVLLAFFGVALSFAEYFLLGILGIRAYIGHLAGMSFTAFAVALFGIFVPSMNLHSELLQSLTRFERMIPYYVCSPIYYFFWRIFTKFNGEVASVIGSFIGILVILCSFELLFLYSFIRDKILTRIELGKMDL